MNVSFRFYPCPVRVNFCRDKKDAANTYIYRSRGQELMDRATTIGSRPPVNFHFSRSFERSTTLSLSLSHARITLHRVDTNRATFNPECYPINVKIFRVTRIRLLENSFFSFSTKQTWIRLTFFRSTYINISKLLLSISLNNNKRATNNKR